MMVASRLKRGGGGGPGLNLGGGGGIIIEFGPRAAAEGGKKTGGAGADGSANTGGTAVKEGNGGTILSGRKFGRGGAIEINDPLGIIILGGTGDNPCGRDKGGCGVEVPGGRAFSLFGICFMTLSCFNDLNICPSVSGAIPSGILIWDKSCQSNWGSSLKSS